jgi:methanogenic corrinoid protein MtbC1
MSLAQTFMRRPQDALAHRSQLARCREDAGFHLAQLASAVELDAPAAFSDYAAWAQEVLRQRGVFPAELARYLGALQDVLAIALPEPIAEVPRRCVRAALDRLARPGGEAAGFIRPEAPFGALARGYLDALRERDRARACQLISDAAAAGTPIEDIYLHVIQTCQYEVGRLWQLNQISTAEEHYCTAVTQMVLSLLYPRVAGAERVNRRLVATSVEGNLHEIGARFIADFFEMAGWDTFYLGASTPTGAVLREVEDRNADVLAVSATLLEHLSAVRDLFSAARRDGRCNKVVLLVGGQPFRAVHGLWRQVGAQGTARAADEAVPLAEALLGARAA